MNLKSISIMIMSLASLLVSDAVVAKSYSTPEARALVVADGKIGQRICYYDDKAYTEGAVLKVADVLLVCAEANDFESNGVLKWVILKKQP
ncbi:YnjH family protein [Vibrio alfacsensis]|uniref:YnjH family protein n=1 Tax=Vibrio alfacsensis TaxID=1074311 RepID=UPI0040687064